MEKEWADKWVVALRSKKYVKTKCFLKIKNGASYCFCASGVLCDIVYPQRWDDVDRKIPEGHAIRHDGWISILSNLVMEQVGIGERGVMKIITLNDTENKSFDEIADFIEKNWETL